MVIRDFLPIEEAEELRKQFEGAKYQRRSQARKELREVGADLIGPGEVYTAQFWRADVVCNEVEKRIRGVLGGERPVDLRAHCMRSGDHFRSHLDDGVGTAGITLTLSKGWKWDWGGILMVLEGGEMKSYLPRFNELVVIKGAPHFVSQVAPWAREPRYTLVGFQWG